jgi:DNA-binding transcriptional LysR family regulator
MNFQQLRCIREGQRRSFNLTEVAAAPHASQPGVSRQIRALEDALGIDIFMLAGKRLTGLSEPGTYGMPIIEKLLSEAENLRRAGTDYAQTGAGTLRIAATHSQVREEPALQTGFSFALSRRSALFRKNGGCWLRVELSGRSSQRNSLVYGLVGLSTAVWPLKHCSKAPAAGPHDAAARVDEVVLCFWQWLAEGTFDFCLRGRSSRSGDPAHRALLSKRGSAAQTPDSCRADRDPPASDSLPVSRRTVTHSALKSPSSPLAGSRKPWTAASTEGITSRS